MSHIASKPMCKGCTLSSVSFGAYIFWILSVITIQGWIFLNQNDGTLPHKAFSTAGEWKYDLAKFPFLQLVVAPRRDCFFPCGSGTVSHKVGRHGRNNSFFKPLKIYQFRVWGCGCKKNIYLKKRFIGKKFVQTYITCWSISEKHCGCKGPRRNDERSCSENDTLTFSPDQICFTSFQFFLHLIASVSWLSLKPWWTHRSPGLRDRDRALLGVGKEWSIPRLSWSSSYQKWDKQNSLQIESNKPLI